VDLELQALWRALQPLRSVASFLMVGAHPDDEWNGFLGWLAYGRGVRTIYACSTRGEGGQSVLGPERGRALAALRSREMERSAAEIDLTLRWIGAGGSHGVDDPMFDFGFSRSGVDTLQRWGEERLVRRLVTLIRTERPDGLSPTFLDVPGQHGHHRAMTQSTLRAFDLAADPAYAVEALAPWRVAKLYLPARSGAGGSYDDELPPPAETVRVDLGEPCPPLGVNWAQLGERSRLYHASQGMGRTLEDGARPFPLHLLAGSPDTALPMDGLVHSLADLAGTLPAGEAQHGLMVADAAINDALSAFPDKARVAGALHAALGALQGLAWPEGAANLADRILLKQRQLGRAAALALGIGARIEMPQVLQAGGQFPLIFSVSGPAQAVLRLPAGWSADIAAGRGGTVSIPAETSAFGTQRDGYDPLGGNEAVGVDLIWTHAGSAARIQVDAPLPLALAPHADVVVQPQRVVRREASGSDVILRLSGGTPPASWPIACAAADGFVVRAQPGRMMLETAGQHLMRIQAPHGGRWRSSNRRRCRFCGCRSPLRLATMWVLRPASAMRRWIGCDNWIFQPRRWMTRCWRMVTSAGSRRLLLVCSGLASVRPCWRIGIV
jgi:LmbE family N-acetylglucosaminyl deacetylase